MQGIQNDETSSLDFNSKRKKTHGNLTRVNSNLKFRSLHLLELDFIAFPSRPHTHLNTYKKKFLSMKNLKLLLSFYPSSIDRLFENKKKGGPYVSPFESNVHKHYPFASALSTSLLRVHTQGDHIKKGIFDKRTLV